MNDINYNDILDRNEIANDFKEKLEEFEKNKYNLLFKRGFYIYGSPGSGKTTFVKSILKELGYDIILFDAGDIRNKSIIDSITHHSMSEKNIISLFNKKTKPLAIVMDEIDGMNNGDKGGINALIKLIRPKKTASTDKEDYERHESYFIEKVRFQNIYNRMIAYDTNDFHRANSYYSGMPGPRLTLVFFIEEIDMGHGQKYPLEKIKDVRNENIIKSESKI